MDRRQLLQAAAAIAALPFVAAVPVFAQTLTPLAQAARDAWIFGLPLIEMARARRDMLEKGIVQNRLTHQRTLATFKYRVITTPNNDTLYSQTWLDLSQGPVRIAIPPTGARYVSVALMDMYTNNFAVLGTRTTGTEGGTFTIVGPQQASADPLAIRSPTRSVWMLVRLLVDGDSDLKMAHDVQDRFRVEGPSVAPPPRTFALRTASWNAYFESVQALIVEDAPLATDARLFASVAPLGLGARGGFNAKRFSASQVVEIEQGIAAAKAMLRTTRRQGELRAGWIYPKADLGQYGQDYSYRAQVAVGGLGALPREEALYMRAVGPNGKTIFDSASSWVLSLPADKLPPVDAFWSLSMYEATADNQYFFTDNAINRYAIGNRTPGLIKGPGGALEILMTRNDPGPELRANWLPTPQSGPFAVTFRAYLPKSEFLLGDYSLLPLRPARRRADLLRRSVG